MPSACVPTRAGSRSISAAGKPIDFGLLDLAPPPLSPYGDGREPGRVRPVYYSWVAAPRIEDVFKNQGALIRDDFEAIANDGMVKTMIADQNVARRLEDLRDAILEKQARVA
jgi:hypothetical protein